jgi:hypothetical protein
MKKWLCLILFVQACAYRPVIDTAGRSGTFDINKSDQITNDLQHCKFLAKDNTSSFVEAGKYVYNYYFRAGTLYLSPKAEYSYPKIYKNCLINRGHSVVN